MSINLNKAKEYEFAVILDASGSTEIKDVKSGWWGTITRWEAIKKSASKFSKDLDSIGNGFLHLVIMGPNGIVSHPSAGCEKVAQALDSNRPGGSTPLAQALVAALGMLKSSAKKKFILVFTDGVPDNRDAAAKVIIDQANSQVTDDECTILFIQVGEDKQAAEYLRMLDDDLKQAKFDIVDCKTASEAETFESTMALIVHAIDD